VAVRKPANCPTVPQAGHDRVVALMNRLGPQTLVRSPAYARVRSESEWSEGLSSPGELEVGGELGVAVLGEAPVLSESPRRRWCQVYTSTQAVACELLFADTLNWTDCA
jgi:hypothetical protein